MVLSKRGNVERHRRSRIPVCQRVWGTAGLRTKHQSRNWITPFVLLATLLNKYALSIDRVSFSDLRNELDEFSDVCWDPVQKAVITFGNDSRSLQEDIMYTESYQSGWVHNQVAREN